MTSRSIAILIASALPSTALTVPMTGPLATNALVAGSLVTVLAALALASKTARRAAIVGTLWVGLSAFLFDARGLDFAIIAPWTVATLVALVGPFSAEPTTETRPAIETAQPIARSVGRLVGRSKERQAA